MYLLLLLPHHTLRDGRLELELMVHVPNECKEIGVLTPVGDLVADKEILAIFGDPIVHYSVHHMDRWRNLGELEWDLHSHIQRLVGLSEEEGDAVVFVGLCALGEH